MKKAGVESSLGELLPSEEANGKETSSLLAVLAGIWRGCLHLMSRTRKASYPMMNSLES